MPPIGAKGIGAKRVGVIGAGIVGTPPPLDSLPQVDTAGTSNPTNVRLTRQKS